MHPAAEAIKRVLDNCGKPRDPGVKNFVEVRSDDVVRACDLVPPEKRSRVINDLRRGSASVAAKDGGDGPLVHVPLEALHHLHDTIAAQPLSDAAETPTSMHPH